MTELPFDGVVIEEGPERRKVSADQFMRIPLSERIRLILGRHVQFLSGERSIDRGLALKSLMDSARSANRG